jgi:hypothetical protein
MISDTRKKLEKIYTRIDKLATKGKEYIFEYYKLVDELIDKGDYSLFEQSMYYFYDIDITKWSSVQDVKKNTWNEILFQTNSSIQKKLKKLFDSKGVYQMGLDFYSDSLNTISITSSVSLGFNYDLDSVLVEQELIIQQNSGKIFVGTNNDELYKIEIYRAEWTSPDNQHPVGSPKLNTLEFLDLIGTQSESILSGTNTLYRTGIATTHGRDYLIKTYLKESLNSVLNYKLSVTKNTYLGQINEVDTFTQDVNYYIQNKQYAKVIGARKTFLEVNKLGATQSFIVESENPSVSEEQNLVNRYKIAIDYLLS